MRTLCKAKKARHERTNTVKPHFHKPPRVVKFIETESRMVGVRGWGRGWGIRV